jgi:hypothetical protein
LLVNEAIAIKLARCPRVIGPPMIPLLPVANSLLLAPGFR